MHRDDGAACLMFNDDGQQVGEYWYSNGQGHREGAPAMIECAPTGEIIYEAHWLNGEECAVTIDKRGGFDVG